MPRRAARDPGRFRRRTCGLQAAGPGPFGQEPIHSTVQSSYAARVRSGPSWPWAARLGRRTPRAAALVALAFGVSACERGCLSTWLADRSASPGGGGERPRGSGDRDGAAGGFDLGGTDCSDGLARCVAGRIEVSVAGHVPHPCTSREKSGACECAWKAAGTCEAGCLEDGLEAVATAEVAIAQLCTPLAPALRPLLPSESAVVTICADESVSCVDGVVRSCPAPGQPARALGACVAGCAAGIGVEPGDLLTSDGAAAILCRRAHAERR